MQHHFNIEWLEQHPVETLLPLHDRCSLCKAEALAVQVLY